MKTQQYLRLILFDIDGTLISTNGIARTTFAEALDEALQRTSAAKEYDLAGKTDQQIYTDIMRASGADDTQISELREKTFDTFFRLLEQRLNRDNVTVLPGVRELLAALAVEQVATVALLTGNMLQGARIKLTPPELLQHFTFGAFGNDAFHRHELPAIAAARAYDRTGATFKAKDIVIIGDTPHDIDCGRHLNVRSIGVASGGYSYDELAKHKPDHCFEDLTDIDRLFSAIFD
ncbi:HAD hydrolase-like protein [bacterium]|nr:HAD hydrolase-like protein [bacterium]